MSVSDVNGDGEPDLLVTYTNANYISLLLNQSSAFNLAAVAASSGPSKMTTRLLVLLSYRATTKRQALTWPLLAAWSFR